MLAVRIVYGSNELFATCGNREFGKKVSLLIELPGIDAAHHSCYSIHYVV